MKNESTIPHVIRQVINNVIVDNVDKKKVVSRKVVETHNSQQTGSYPQNLWKKSLELWICVCKWGYFFSMQ